MSNSTYVYVITIAVPKDAQNDDTDTDLRVAMETALAATIPNREIVITFEGVV